MATTPTSTLQPALTMYGIPNCDTVKKARVWLTSHGIDYQFHDFKKQGVPPQALDHWLEQLGWTKVLNRQGTTWRKLDPEAQATVVDNASAASVLMEHPSCIKRPVMQWSNSLLTVGFAPDDWEHLAKQATQGA
jgi:arsenate reductase